MLLNFRLSRTRLLLNRFLVQTNVFVYSSPTKLLLCKVSIFLNFSGIEPEIILELFLTFKGVTESGNEKNILKSLFMSYLIIKKAKNDKK